MNNEEFISQVKEIMREPTVLVLSGISGSGKSTLAKELDTYVLSSDEMRGILSGDEGDQKCNREAFDLVHQILNSRCGYRQSTIVDTTALIARFRMPFHDKAKEFNLNTAIILFKSDVSTSTERIASRERKVPNHIIAKQFAMMANTWAGIGAEPWDHILVWDTLEGKHQILR